MVLQQQTEACLWGKANANAEVTIRPSWNRETYKVLEADEDLEFLHRLPGIEVLVVVGPYTAYREIQSVPCHILVNRRYLETESHPFVVDGLVGFQELIHGFVDSFGNPSLDDMGHDYIGSVDYLLREHTVCST